MPTLQASLPAQGTRKSTLVVAWCDYKAAEYAALNWHYAHRMPVPPRNHLGVWEDNVFIGAVIFSRGASPSLGKRYGLGNTEFCELTRVALRGHKTPVTQILKIAIRMLRRQNPGLRAIFSFADANRGHIGSIYQAGNWLYLGRTHKCYQYIDRDGVRWHTREIVHKTPRKQMGTGICTVRKQDCRRVLEVPKFRYAYVLDESIKPKFLANARPYPKAAEVKPVTRSATS